MVAICSTNAPVCLFNAKSRTFHFFYDNLSVADIKTDGNERIVGGCRQVIIGSIFVGWIKGPPP